MILILQIFNSLDDPKTDTKISFLSINAVVVDFPENVLYHKYTVYSVIEDFTY